MATEWNCIVIGPEKPGRTRRMESWPCTRDIWTSERCWESYLRTRQTRFRRPGIYSGLLTRDCQRFIAPPCWVLMSVRARLSVASKEKPDAAPVRFSSAWPIAFGVFVCRQPGQQRGAVRQLLAGVGIMAFTALAGKDHLALIVGDAAVVSFCCATACNEKNEAIIATKTMDFIATRRELVGPTYL